MTSEEEIEYYRDVLDRGASLLCDAVGINTERYDRDQADGECYMDCFRDMAALLQKSGFYYCENDNEFKRKVEVAQENKE